MVYTDRLEHVFAELLLSQVAEYTVDRLTAILPLMAALQCEHLGG